METWVVRGHAVLAILLIFLYIAIIIRLFRGKAETATAGERAMGHVARLSLLLLYVTGLLMSVQFNIFVSPVHHYASLLPILVILLFQFIPALRGQGDSPRAQAYTFIAMLIAVSLIAASAHLSIAPKF